MYQPRKNAVAAARKGYVSIWYRQHAFRIIRIPKRQPESIRYRAIHESLIAPEELCKASRNDIMSVYKALEHENVQNALSRDYIQALLERTVAIKRALLPEDYARIYQRLSKMANVSSGFTSDLNEGIRLISTTFNTKQIAMLIKAFAELSTRSLGTINDLLKTFNRYINEAEPWQLRDIAAALATLRVPTKDQVERFYNQTVAHIPKHLKYMTADDIGLILNAFIRQKHNCEEILHYVDAHAKRLLSECSFRTAALVANAFAKSERQSRVLIETVSNRLKQEVEKYTLNKRNTIGSIDVIGTALTEDQSGSELDSNLQIQAINTSRQGKQLNIIDVAMIFNAFAKMEEHPLELLNAYIPWLMDHIQSETPTLSLVLLCHAYSRSGVVNKDLYIKMAHVLIQRINALNCQQLGIVALAYAKTKQNIPILFFRIADEVIYRGTVALKFKRYHFDFQSLEQLSQAFTRVGFQDQRVYIVLTTLLKRRLKTAGTDEIDGDLIASTLTSMAPHQVEAFKTFITDAIMRTKDTTAYSTGAICRVLSAFGKLKIAHKAITEAMLNQAKDRVNEFQIPVLINTLKALAKLNKYNLTLIKEALKRCSMHLVHLSTIDIANLLSALSDFGYRNVPFLQKLILCIKHRIEDFDRSQLHIVFSRLALLRTSDPDVYRQIIPRLFSYQHDFTELQIADIAIGYIYMLVHFDYLQRDVHLRKMAQEVTERRQQVMSSVCINELNKNTQSSTSQDICNALSINKNTGNGVEEKAKPGHYYNAKYTMPTPATNVAQYGFRDSILDGVLSHLGTKLDVATIFKIQTVHLYLQYIRPDIYSQLSAKSLEILHRCSAVRFALAEYMLTSSGVHREVSHLLNILGVCHNNEVQFGPYLIDIVAETTQARKIAIEYDGPTHFYAETTMRTAKSILKHEILENTGWQVLHIPYQEWSQLLSTKQKIIYLDQLRKQFQNTALLTPNVIQKHVNNIQTRTFSTSLKRKRQHLLKVNEEILKEYIEAIQRGESSDKPVENNTQSATELIADELCTMLMEGTSNIIDIDEESKSSDKTINNAEKTS